MSGKDITFKEWFLINELKDSDAALWINYEKSIKENPDGLRYNNIFGNKDRIVIPYTQGRNILEDIEKSENVKIDWDNKNATIKTQTQQGEKEQVVKLGKFIQKLLKNNPSNEEYKQLLRAFETGQDVRPKSDMSVIISRKPIDIVRMSDFTGSRSCHTPGASYWSSAQSEAAKGGVIAYLVKTDDLKGVDLDSEEIFRDDCRGLPGLTPLQRVRLRSFAVDGKNILIPEDKFYLVQKQGSHVNDKFYKIMRNWALKNNPELKNIPKDLFKFKLHGGVSDSRSSEILAMYFGLDEDYFHGKPEGESTTDDDWEGNNTNAAINRANSLAQRIRNNGEDHHFDPSIYIDVVPSLQLPNEFVEKLFITYKKCFNLNEYKLLVDREDFPDENDDGLGEDDEHGMDIHEQLSKMLLIDRIASNREITYGFKTYIQDNNLCVKAIITHGAPGDRTASEGEAERFFDIIDKFSNHLSTHPDSILKGLENAGIIQSKHIVQNSPNIKIGHREPPTRFSSIMRDQRYNQNYDIEVNGIEVGSLSGLVNGEGGFSTYVPKENSSSITEREDFLEKISFDDVLLTDEIRDDLEKLISDNKLGFHINVYHDLTKFNPAPYKEYIKSYHENPKQPMPDIKVAITIEIFVLKMSLYMHDKTQHKKYFEMLDAFIAKVKKDLPVWFQAKKAKALPH